MKYIGFFFAASQVAARLHEAPRSLPPPPHHMSRMEREAFNKIEEVCQDDMERHCRPPEEATTDPILKWLMAPERLAPPMMHPQALEPMDPINIGPLLDHMMDTALRMPMMMRMEPEPQPSFFLMLESSPSEEQPAEEFVLDSMVSRLMQQSDCTKERITQSVNDEQDNAAQDITHHIRLKGQHVLEQEDVPEDRRRLARRLTEVTPEEMIGHWQHPIHPFFRPPAPREHQHMCPRKHKCLMQAREQNKLFPECHGALTRLEKVQEVEKQQRQEMQLYVSFFWFYCILFFALFSMILIRRFKSSKGLFLLRLRVLQAVYSNPEIKAKVEDEVGAPLGAVPPLPSVGLKMLSREGRNQCRQKRLRFCRMLYVIMAFFALDAFGVLPDIWPLFVMGACCVFMVYRMLNLCCSQPEKRECKCCCCGGSTSDVENGTISKAQACCSCCKGTGVCATKCSSCCGTSGCNCGKDGCDGSCDCCGDSELALGYTLMVADDCKCCCCGSTASAAANGTLTDVQACCTCCKGTGKCSKACANCCGGGGCDKGCDGGCPCCKPGKKDCALLDCALMVADDCKCCCCGSTATAAANGTLTDVQACCSCCKGTGKCSKACANCCGGGGCDKGCDGGCPCCKPGKKDCALLECTLMVADDCTCCCCGGTATDAANGTLTDVQACCTCCKGTGKCPKSCANCCGGGGCDKGCDGGCPCCKPGEKKHKESKTVVYQGVPVQIV